jgi:hypothetical protein
MATLTEQQQDEHALDEPRGGSGRQPMLWVGVILGIVLVAAAVAIVLSPMPEAEESPAEAAEQPVPKHGTAEGSTRRLVNEGYLPAQVLHERNPLTNRIVNEGLTIDLLAGSMPADEPELARARLSCLLPDEDLCTQLVELALDLDFVWHRAGYAIRMVDGSQAPAPRDGGTRITGRARTPDRTIDLFIPWADTVMDVPAAFRSVKRTLAHELGHAMHQTCEASDPLDRWREARKIPPEVPTHGHGFEGHSFNSVAEDFADSAMAWLTRGEFRDRSPIEEEAFEPAYPGHTRPPTQVPPELAAKFFFICA